MYRMLTAFNLKPGISPETFRDRYDAFVAEMQNLGLVTDSGPIGKRDTASPLDTDADRPQQYFALMNFTGRSQAERAYGWIRAGSPQTSDLHQSVIALGADMVFVAWEDF